MAASVKSSCRNLLVFGRVFASESAVMKIMHRVKHKRVCENLFTAEYAECAQRIRVEKFLCVPSALSAVKEVQAAGLCRSKRSDYICRRRSETNSIARSSPAADFFRPSNGA